MDGGQQGSCWPLWVPRGWFCAGRGRRGLRGRRPAPHQPGARYSDGGAATAGEPVHAWQAQPQPLAAVYYVGLFKP